MSEPKAGPGAAAADQQAATVAAGDFRSDDDLPIGIEEAARLLAPALAEAGRVLLAVSGGPDSVALMRLCATLMRRDPACNLHVATVDHGLRAGSRAEAERVGLWARDCGLTHSILTWEGVKPTTRIQERARVARYALLAAKAREIGASLFLTAHTLDDQAETVLMRIAHGSGLAGLAAMRPLTQRRPGLRHGRPFLGIAKARLLATCRANAWPFVEDPSNADPRFARARWRKLAPALRKEGLTARRLAKLAERAASAEEALETKAVEAFASARLDAGRLDAGRLEADPHGIVLDMVRLIEREPRDIALRVLLLALAELRGQDGQRDQETAAPIRLERVEGAVAALYAAVAERRALRCTLAGAVLACDAAGRLRLRPEPSRRRGRKPAETAPAAGSAREAREGGLEASPNPANQGNSNASMVLV
ncbi:tRNA(Ile)-lysidine synthase [Rhizobiales bacterium GAS188]|nr:tRNA(Ile)-lysidine synthase [Rhizobiales bacterium GAS188]